MKLTDPYVLKQLKIVNSGELYEMLEEYPEDERDGRSDIQMLADEAGWLLNRFNSDETGHNFDLIEAREILRETENGKVIPLEDWTWKFKYQPWKIQRCKDIVNEYKRLNNLIARLKEKGVYSQWL